MNSWKDFDLRPTVANALILLAMLAIIVPLAKALVIHLPNNFAFSGVKSLVLAI